MTDHNNGTYSTTYTASSVGVINVSVYFAGSGSALLPGLAGEYFQNWDFTGISNCNVDPVIEFNFGGGVPWPLRFWGFSQYIGIRWTGQLLAPTSELFTFHIGADDYYTFYIDGVMVADEQSTWETWQYPTKQLNAGQYYDIVLEWK